MKKTNNYVKYILIALCISLVLEIFLFNYTHFISFFYPEESTVEYNCYPDGLMYHLQSDTTYYKYVVNIYNVDKKINNIYIDLKSDADIDLYLTDEANKNLYDAKSHTISKYVPKSNYIKVHTSGKTSVAKLEIVSEVENLNINSIQINKVVPIFFSFMRYIVCFIIIFLIIIFKKYSLLQKNFEEFKYKYLLIVVIIFIILGMYIFINFSSRGNFNSNSDQLLSEHHQYALLAQSLSKGKFSIDLPVSDKLLNLDNPYDQAYRDEFLVMNKDYYLDYAFYNGKYYSYFGVVPCILLYLPYYLVTGNNLNTAIAMLVCCSFYVLSAFYLVYQLFKKYFPNATFQWYLLFSLMLALSSGISYIIRIGHFYGVPISMGAAFAMMGIGLWLKASLSKNIDRKYLCLGAICLALVAGCRPQIILSSFLIFPIFWNHIKNKEIFKLKNLLALAIPYIIVASFLMYYNYARFGSVFDFGANYNLTSNDMTKRGFVWGRTGLGIFSFLFEYPKITTIFPFINYYPVATTYHGITIAEDLAGGFLAINILAWLNVFIFKFKTLFKNKNSLFLCILCLIFGLIIVVADTQMAGIIPRYICDFGFLLSISTLIIAMTILTNYKGNIALIKKLFLYVILISLFINFLVYFTDGLRVESNTYRHMFQYVYYLFMFWL